MTPFHRTRGLWSRKPMAQARGRRNYREFHAPGAAASPIMQKGDKPNPSLAAELAFSSA